MSTEMGIVIAILIVAIVLFVSEKVRVDIVSLGVVVALMLGGILTTNEALAGFSNSAVITIGALFVIGGAVMRTGLADLIGRNILQVAGTKKRSLPLAIMLVAAIMSAFISDTGTVAVLLPVVVMIARNANIASSKLLIPLSYGALFGGAVTLIGSPPNIIVSDVLGESGYDPFRFFSYTPLGLTLLISGITVMALFGKKLLPNRPAERIESTAVDPKQIIETYRFQEDMARLRVCLNSPLIGQTVAQANLRRDYDIDLLKIMRPPQPWAELSLIGSVTNGKIAKSTPVMAQADTVLELDDVLIVMGGGEKINQAAVQYNLANHPPKPKDHKALVGREVGIAEILVPRMSKLIGKTVTETQFQARHGLNVLSIYRPNAVLFDDVRDLKLQFGDVLIVHGPWSNLIELTARPRDYIVLGQPESLARAATNPKVIWVGLILLGMIVAMMSEWLPLTQVALVAAGAVVLIGCITMDEAYRAIDWRSLVLIAGMIPMSSALAKVGLVDVIATGLVSSLGPAGPVVMLAGLFILTATFTQFLSNTATVVIVAPIALTAAQNLGIQPEAFLMGVAVAGSMAFASPIASPVNTLVMGPGNYQFVDYLKAGLPLIILSLLLSLLILPWLFPF